MPNNSWRISTASDDILNFIVYIGCAYGLIENYNGKEKLWPNISLNTDVKSENWEEWIKEAVNLEVEKISVGKHPYTIIEDYMPPDFSNVINQSIKNCFL